MKVLNIIKEIVIEWSFYIFCLAVMTLILSLFYIILSPIAGIVVGLAIIVIDKIGWPWSLAIFAVIAFSREFIKRYKK